MNTTADIKDIANYTILRLIQNGQSICPLKLQKVLYYIQAWHMVYFNGDKIFQEAPEAWVNGPVYRDVYDLYKTVGIYDNIPISHLGVDIENLDSAVKAKKESLSLSEDQDGFLEAIYKHYGSMSHDRLVFLTHSEKPWNTARIGLSPIEYSDNVIDLGEMEAYYKSLSNKQS